MARKRYDERDVLFHFRTKWQAEINYWKAVILLPKNSSLSIHDCGKLDFLTNHCGWRQGWYVPLKGGAYVEVD